MNGKKNAVENPLFDNPRLSISLTFPHKQAGGARQTYPHGVTFCFSANKHTIARENFKRLFNLYRVTNQVVTWV